MSRDHRQDERGQSLVEFALVFPVLLMMAATAFQLALLFFAEIALSNTTRDGARWLAIHPDTVDSTAASAIASRISSPLDPTKVTVTLTPSCTALVSGRCTSRPAGRQLSVTMTYDASSLDLFRSYYFPNTFRTYTVYMRAEPR